MGPTRRDPDDALRKSFAVIELLKAQLAEARQATDEPIAVIGMACRFPGGANTPEAFWNLLSSGADTLRTIPADRWDWRQFYHADPEHPGTHYVRHGSFLDQVDGFDPEFFGISGREANQMDPQHRLLLEVSWEAIEAAGVPPPGTIQSRTGVYVGIGQNDYAQLQMFGGQPERISAYDGTGTSFCFASARLSYVLGLQGPNMTVDTACSSSLVALHLACQALRNRECDRALAGGAHLVISPEVTIYLSRLKALSADGRSKAFSADADGYGRGEGCGMLVLKRVSDARQNGDQILALIRGSAVNHDGASSGLTVPNGQAQRQLLREALRRAGVRAEEIGWIEAHGTGTSLGDPIEAAALADVFPRDLRDGRPLYLSSVKTNIGHLEAASGIASVIKVILAMRQKELPPHLNFTEPHPDIGFPETSFCVPLARTPWVGPEQRIAGVSAFGLGGTNAHIILSEAAHAPQSPAPETSGYLPLVLSARTPAALAELSTQHCDFLRETDLPFEDIAWTAAQGRKHFEYRIAVTARNAAEAAERLGQSGAAVAVPDGPPKIAFLFSGQGSQYCGMGRRLLEVPVFRDAALDCAELVRKESGWSPWSFLSDETPDLRIHQTEYTQPALFTLQYALVCMWRAWGVEPRVVVGHSIGEFAAAWTAGVLSLEDAVRLVVARGKLMQRLPEDGGMAALRMTEADARRGIAPYSKHLWIAAVNGPQAVAIAGRIAELDQCLARFEQDGVAGMRLPVSHAFHTPRMEPMLRDFAAIANDVDFVPPRVEFLPTGSLREAASSADVAGADYWLAQVLNPVQFARAAAELASHSVDIVLEIGPSGSLLPLARQSAALPQNTAWVSSLQRSDTGSGIGAAACDALGHVYKLGGEIAWREVFPQPRRFVRLPTYPFQRRRCWLPDGLSKTSGSRHWRQGSGHPLLGERLASPLPQQIYAAQVSAANPSFLGDHRIQGDVVFPAAGFIEMALAVAAEHFVTDRVRLTAIEFLRPLRLDEAGTGVRLQTIAQLAGNQLSISIHSRAESAGNNDAWQEHMTCTAAQLSEGVDGTPGRVHSGEVISSIPGADFYSAPRARGIEYGPAFQTLVSLRSCSGDSSEADFSVGITHGAPWCLHPVILDAALQSLAAAQPRLGERTYIPVSIDQLDFSPGLSGDGCVYCHTGQGLGTDMQADLAIADEAGTKRIELRGIRMRQIDRGVAEAIPVFEPVWQPAGTPDKSPRAGRWHIVSEDDALAHAVAARLEQGGATVAIGLEGIGGTSNTSRITGVCYLANADKVEQGALALLQTLGAMPEADQPRVLLVTRGAQLVEAGGDIFNPHASALWGLGRVARNEFPSLRCACVDLDPIATTADCAEALFAECRGTADEDQIAWRNGARHVLRLSRQSAAAEVHRHTSGTLVCETAGDLNSLVLRPVIARAPSEGEVRVSVRAAGLNFKDVLHALGKLEMPGGSGFGFDAAGVVEAVPEGEQLFAIGDRVMLTLTPGSVADAVNARTEFVHLIPARISFEQAAAIPLAFLTAWHALVNVAHVRAGMRVLVHSAMGGVGQAAIQIARYLGAEVFATCSPAKQHLALAQGCTHVYSSRSGDFGGRILKDTRGEGIDVVLNSLSGSMISAGFDCLRSQGFFIEIGKAGIWGSAEAAEYRPGVQFRCFDLAEIARERPAAITEMLRKIVDLMESGALHPIRTRAFSAASVVDAFRLMSRSRHIGKIVIRIGEREAPQGGTHLVTGALGALGQSLCEYLVSVGVKNLALLVHSEPVGERRVFLETLRQRGIKVQTYALDIADRNAVDEVIRKVAADFPRKLSAIYHAAGMLADAAILNQTPDSFERVALPKVAGAWNLHEATRGLELERFVLFSSASALMGTPGQSNYAAANAALDALSALRHTEGLPALSINWGPWGGAGGMGAKLSEADRHRMQSRGVELLPDTTAWKSMEQLLKSGTTQALVMAGDWAGIAVHDQAERVPSLLRGLSTPRVAPVQSSADRERGLLDEIREAPQEQRRRILQSHLQSRIASILGRPDAQSIRPSEGFFSLGMDSLTSMELRNQLQARLQCALPATLAFDYGTVDSLSAYLLEQVPAWSDARTLPQATHEQRSILEMLPENELAELLARELGGL